MNVSNDGRGSGENWGWKTSGERRLDFRLGGMASAFGGGFRNRRRDRIISKAPPWVAAQDSFDAQPTSLDSSVCLDSLDKILRASGNKSASRVRPAQAMQRWGNRDLIESHQLYQQPFHGIRRSEAGSCGTGSRPSLRTIESHSSRTSAKVAFTAIGRGMVTIIPCPLTLALCSRAISRSLRLRRFLFTAFPSRLVRVNPNRTPETSACFR